MVLDKEASNLAAGYVIEERKHFPNTLGRVRILATTNIKESRSVAFWELPSSATKIYHHLS